MALQCHSYGTIHSYQYGYPASSTITLHRHNISARIQDRYANVVYTFDFENTDESGSRELKFEITIDPDAFIAGFEANIDGELFVGQTKEKQKAAKEYKVAQQKNENAILISQPHQDIPNVFQISTNIDAKSKVALTITVQQYLAKKFHFNELRVEILRNFPQFGIHPNFKAIQVNLSINDESDLYDVEIPNGEKIKVNEKEMSKDGKNCEMKAEIASTSKMNELRMRYKIKGEAQESHVLYDAKSGTFCHIISDIFSNAQIISQDEQKATQPSNEENPKYLIPRRVVFVLDRSCSMSGGGKWEKCVASTVMAIKHLRAGIDKFRIILFDDQLELLPEPPLAGCVLADPASVSLTLSVLQSKRTGGCTDINQALLKAVQLIKLDDDDHDLYMNQIIFITDGEANRGEQDSKQIVLNVNNANKLDNKISIFSFGVGRDDNDSTWTSDLNHSLLKILSVNNNGFYHRIKQATADSALSEYFNILSNPILSRINVEYHNKHISELSPCKFSALYDGNDLIICGKMKGAVHHDDDHNDDEYHFDVSILATTGICPSSSSKTIKAVNIEKKMRVNVTAITNDGASETDEDTKKMKNVERIWAYLKLQEHAKRKLLFNDMIELDDEEKSEQDKEPYALAMKYQFVTPWTSMIVVKKKHENQDEGKKQEANRNEQPLNETRFINLMAHNYRQSHSHSASSPPYVLRSSAHITSSSSRIRHSPPAVFSNSCSNADSASHAYAQQHTNRLHSLHSHTSSSVLLSAFSGSSDSASASRFGSPMFSRRSSTNSNRNLKRNRCSRTIAISSAQPATHMAQSRNYSHCHADMANTVQYSLSSAQHPMGNAHVLKSPGYIPPPPPPPPPQQRMPRMASQQLPTNSTLLSTPTQKMSQTPFVSRLKDCNVDQLVSIVMYVAMKDEKCALYAYRDLIVKYLRDNAVDGGKFVSLAKAEKNTKLFNELKNCLPLKDTSLDQALQEFIDSVLNFNVVSIN